MNKQRERMVEKIEKEYGLKSPEVLSVMRGVPREKFVSKIYKLYAYSDWPVSIGYGQTMSQPYTVAFMTHVLLSSKQEVIREKVEKWKVLEIGTGLGYQAAVLSKLVGKVYSIEIIKELAESAKERVKRLGYKNVYVKAGSGEKGWSEKAPFDAIMITAQLTKVPKIIFNQLKTGGVLVAPIGNRSLQVLTRFTRGEKGKMKKEEFQKYVFVPFVTKGV